MTQPEVIKSLLNAVAIGEVSPEVALNRLKHLTFESVEDFARIDHHRTLRTGFPEVIWGEGKTPEQIAQIMNVMRQRSPIVMATRIAANVYPQLKSQVADLTYYATARICALRTNGSTPSAATSANAAATCPGTISILSAGTADLPVAEEAAVTAELCGLSLIHI